MMITAARTISRRVATAKIVPRSAAAVGSTRCMAIGDTLGKKVSNYDQRYFLILLLQMNYQTNSEAILFHKNQITI